MLYLLVLGLQLLFVEIVEVEVARVLFRVPMLGTEHIVASALDPREPHFLLAVPAARLIILHPSSSA